MLLNHLTRHLYPNLSYKIQELDSLILKLADRRQQQIYPGDALEMPKVVWKYKIYNEIALHRVVDLAAGTCDDWNQGFVGKSFNSIRAIYETVAYVYDIKKRVEKFCKENNHKELDELIMNRLFGTKLSNSTFPEITNVLTVIGHTDKDIPGYLENYERISEFYHPNYSAMLGLYVTFHEASHTAEINSASAINECNLTIIVSSLGYILTVMNYTLYSLSELYEPLTNLCIDNLEKPSEVHKTDDKENSLS